MARLAFNVKNSVIDFLYHRFDTYNKPERTWQSIAQDIEAEFKVKLNDEYVRSLMCAAGNIPYLGKLRQVAIRKPVRTQKPKAVKLQAPRQDAATQSMNVAIANMEVGRVTMPEDVRQAMFTVLNYFNNQSGPASTTTNSPAAT